MGRVSAVRPCLAGRWRCFVATAVFIVRDAEHGALQKRSGKSQASLTFSNIEAKPSTPAPVPAPEPLRL